MSKDSNTESKKGRTGRKPKYDYQSQEFLDKVAVLAKQMYTDKEIALSLGLSAEEFCRKKGNIPQLTQVLQQARAQVCATIRGAFIKSAIGGRVVTRTEYVKKKCPKCAGKGLIVDSDSGEVEECPNCGGTGWIRLTDKAIVVEQTIPPSVQAQTTLLLAYDEDLKKRLKRNDESDLNKITGIDVEVTYNKKEDLDLQKRTKKSDEVET